MVQSDRAMQQKGAENLMAGVTSAVGNVAGAYTQNAMDAKTLKGMDTAVMGMSDLGAITPDFRDKYLSADEATRPFLFQALASPMFQSYNAGQTAAVQAKAWDEFKSKWGAGGNSAPSSGNNKYGYVYQGP
jgi:hypothetical protein